MAKQDKELIAALKEELKGYELYGKAERAKAVKDAIKKAGGSVETKTAKPKAEKSREKRSNYAKRYRLRKKENERWQKVKNRKKGR